MPKLAAVRLFAAVVLLSAVTSTIFAAGLASPAAASPTGWSSGSLIDPLQGEPTSISCPTSTFCATVDEGGNVLTYNGVSWSSPKSIDPSSELESVSCTSASFCVAVDENGNVLTYNGSLWSSPNSIDQSTLSSVSCPTTTFCATVDENGDVLTYNGVSWSQPDSIDPSGGGLTSVSCPTSTFCATVDGNGNVLTYNGVSWWSLDSIDPSGGGLTSVSCPSASFCVAMDQSGNVLTYNGSLWTSPHNIDAGDILGSISCPTTSFCAALDYYDHVFTYNGTSWSLPDPIDAPPPDSGDPGFLSSVSCPTTSFCAAVDMSGNVLTYSGSLWSSPHSIETSGGQLTSVSCPTASFCAAVDHWGYVLTYNGSSWSSPERIDPGSELLSVSCHAASFCVAVDDAGNVLTYNGSLWSSPNSIDQSTLSSVSCPTTTFCAAVDENGDVLTYNGVSWSQPDSIDAGSTGYLISVSCPTASFCAAVDASGNALTYKDGSWSSPEDVDQSTYGLSSVSCPTASFCAADDSSGYVLTYNGTSWSSPYDFDPGASMQSISCPTTTFCAAVDWGGYALTYNGSSWSSPDDIDPSGNMPLTVSCPTASFCAAVDEYDVFTYSALTQGTPTTASVADGAGYSGQLTVTNAVGTLTYTETSSTDSTDVVVGSTGAITAATSLAPGTYTVGGTDSDTNGDTGTWAFALTVRPAIVTLTQGTPTTASVADGAGYSGQLTVTNAVGTLTYTETSSTDSTDVVVGSTGAITAATSLAPGTYTVSGTDHDTNGDTGTWGFALTVRPAIVTLTQGTPTTASVADGAGYSGQLTVTNAVGTLTYTETSSTDSTDVVVGSTGAITAATSLAPGTYTVGGTDSDTNGDTGTWGFALTVRPAIVTLTQGTPTTASVADGAGYSGQLTVTNAVGTLIYTETSSTDSTDVVVGSTGAITAATSLAPGTYTVGGTDSDTNGDTGTWGFALTVRPAIVTLTQGTPTTASVADGAGYSGQLTVTNAVGTLIYTETSSTDSTDVVVGSTGAITAATSLAPGTYTVGGTDSDTNGDTGTWAFALTVRPAIVTLTQGTPTTASVADGAGYSGQLTVTNAVGTLIYTETSSTDSTDVVVGSTGAITAASSLAPGTYTVSGTDHDTNGDTGTWGFALTVGTLTQGTPTSASVADGAGYSGQLTVTNAVGTLIYTETSSTDSTDVVVGSTGAITAASSLAPGTYTVSGTDHDTNGDTGTWGFALTVNPVAVTPPPSSGPPSPPSPPPGATSSQDCSSSSSSSTCSATNDDTTASGSGEGAVTVSQYASDPVGSPSFSTPGEYFDVQVASGSSFASLTITDCNLNGATSLEWWNPQADAGAGAWEPVSPAPTYTSGPPACVAATISSTSSPSLSQLTGTVFGVAALATAPGAPTKVSAKAGNASATLTWTAPSSDGGTAITGYVIKASHGPVVKVGDVTSDTVTGLNNGTTYSFTISAVNSAGTGPSSAVSNSVTPVKATSETSLKLSSKKVTYGDEKTEHLTVSVTAGHSGTTATGTVTIKATVTTLCVIKLSSGKGSCTLSAKRLKAGTYHLVATYGGNKNYQGSASAKVTLTVVK